VSFYVKFNGWFLPRMADFGGLTVEAFRKDGDISFVDSDGTVSEALDVRCSSYAIIIVIIADNHSPH